MIWRLLRAARAGGSERKFDYWEARSAFNNASARALPTRTRNASLLAWAADQVGTPTTRNRASRLTLSLRSGVRTMIKRSIRYSTDGSTSISGGDGEVGEDDDDDASAEERCW